MTRLIITRHGQSIANAEHRFAGHSDFDLSELGYAQAELMANYICAHESPEVIYSSDLMRAHHTALPTAKRLGLEVILTQELREIFAGNWEGKTTDELAVEFEHDFSVWRNDYANSRCTGGESTAEVYHRIIGTVSRLATEHDGHTVMLSTHATVVRSLCAYSLGLSPERTGEIPFTHNASVNIFEYENGKLTPIATDIIEHLGDMVSGVHKSFNKQ